MPISQDADYDDYDDSVRGVDSPVVARLVKSGPANARKGLKVMKHDGVDDALRVVSEHFGVSVADIRSQRRTRAIHPARVWGMYLACVTTDATFAEIGRRFGGRDQSIVRMCARACDRAAAGNEDDARLFDTLKARCKTLNATF